MTTTPTPTPITTQSQTGIELSALRRRGAIAVGCPVKGSTSTPWTTPLLGSPWANGPSSGSRPSSESRPSRAPRPVDVAGVGALVAGTTGMSSSISRPSTIVGCGVSGSNSSPSGRSLESSGSNSRPSGSPDVVGGFPIGVAGKAAGGDSSIGFARRKGLALAAVDPFRGVVFDRGSG